MTGVELDDYSNADGFLGWIGRDPFFRICILAEATAWLILTLVIYCCVYALRRSRCLRGRRAQKYAPSFLGDQELRDRGSVSKSVNSDSLEPEVASLTRKTCRGRCIACTCACGTSLFVGFFVMVALLAVTIPFIMPNMLYIPVTCEDAPSAPCLYVPGAKNHFVSTSSGNNVSVRLFPALSTGKYYSKRFSLMYSNPNGGYTPFDYEVYERLAAFGVSVYAWDYPGYMLSSGTPDYSSVMEAAEAVLRFVAAHSINNPEDVILAGRSLGGAVSIALSERFRGTKALILVNPLDSLKSLLGDCCSLSGWASGLYYGRGHFDARRSLASFGGCLLQYAAEDDVIVYFRRQRRMFFEYSDRKRKGCSVFVKGAGMGHNDDQWELDSFVKALNVFFTRLTV